MMGAVSSSHGFAPAARMTIAPGIENPTATIMAAVLNGGRVGCSCVNAIDTPSSLVLPNQDYRQDLHKP